MRAVKSVKQNYSATPQILELLEEFRKMVNDCVRIGLAENVTSLKTLSLKAYHQSERYRVPTCYRLTAISKATGILRNYRKTLRKHPNVKKPYADKLMLTDCYAFKIADGKLRLSLGNKKFAFMPLNQHTLTVISGYTVRFVNLTARNMSLAFSKETAMADVTGLIGLDRNVGNVATATLDGTTTIYDLSEAAKIKMMYREIKSHFRRNDARVAKKVQQKYGKLQRDRVQPILHNVSKRIVQKAKAEHFGIVMENLKGIRKLYRKGNGQGNEYRSQLNSWSFAELQRQIEYKAKWENIPVIYVPAAKTSSICAICGCKIVECIERQVYCPNCKRAVDRDENAALNIVRAGLRFSLKGEAGEAMMPVKRWQVDASQLTQMGEIRGINYPTTT